MGSCIENIKQGWSRDLLSNPAPFILASRLASYPSPLIVEDVAELIKHSAVNYSCASVAGDAVWEPLYGALRQLVTDSEHQESVAARYIDIFDRGSVENSLYETEYGLSRSQLKTGELADISGFYQAFGFRVAEESENREMLDHLAVECEFYALLLAKQEHLQSRGDDQGVEIVYDARKKFLQAHLGRYPRAVADRPGVVSDPLYSQVFRWCADLVDNECSKLNVDVVPADYLYFGGEEDQISCGAVDNALINIGGKSQR